MVPTNFEGGGGKKKSVLKCSLDVYFSFSKQHYSLANYFNLLLE